MASPLPSLKALAIFETAGRHQGFARAAEELGVTAAAVSQQIKLLETELDCALFFRSARGVALTSDGQSLLVAVQRGLDHIAAAVTRLRSGPDAITIQATTAVSSLWLTPRLSQFWRSRPDVQVTQHVTDNVRRSDRADLHICYGNRADDVGDTRPLFDDEIIALATPELAQQLALHTVDELGSAPLVHLAVAGTEWTSWREWADTRGFSGPLRDGMTVDNYTIALQAARDGVGLVLGWRRLVHELLDRGELVQVLDHGVPAPHEFYLWVRGRPTPNIEALANHL